MVTEEFLRRFTGAHRRKLTFGMRMPSLHDRDVGVLIVGCDVLVSGDLDTIRTYLPQRARAQRILEKGVSAWLRRPETLWRWCTITPIARPS